MSEQPKLEQDESKEEGLVNDLITSIMTPGYTAKGVVKLMFQSFYALFVTLFCLLIITKGNLHVLALLIISICLFVTLRWFIKEMEAIKLAEAESSKDDAKSEKKE